MFILFCNDIEYLQFGFLYLNYSQFKPITKAIVPITMRHIFNFQEYFGEIKQLGRSNYCLIKILRIHNFVI